jgi:glucose-1-phosphate thymidylyltransferase
MIGVILSGGTGSRLWPLTASVNKHLLPVYDKPMIYYPLTTLLLAGIREIVIVCPPNHAETISQALGDGSNWGIKITYAIQEEPNGIVGALKVIPLMYHQESIALILGDNLLYGMGLGTSLQTSFSGTGAKIFGYSVANPQEFGVLEVDENNSIVSIEEKPQEPKSHLAIPGLYFFDATVFTRTLKVQIGTRGEYEIIDLLDDYLKDKLLDWQLLERGTAWLDTGNATNLISAGEFVRVLEDRQGLKIGCPYEASLRLGLVNRDQFLNVIRSLPNSIYKNYLTELSTRFGGSKI